MMKPCRLGVFPYRMLALLFTLLVVITASFGQSQDPGKAGKPDAGQSPSTSAPSPSTAQNQSSTAEPAKGKQSDRILGVIPNYRAVSADTHLPPLSFKGKFKLATEDSFDYSSFLVTGVVAGVAQARNQTPEFHQGAAGYARYFWHSFADQAVGDYFTELIVPYATREDPRYYTLFHGGFFKRSAYAVGRLFITRTDAGGQSFNFSEIVGNGAAAGISDLYYPSPERTWTKTGQKWASQVALDGIFNLMKEFWPDIRHHLLRQ